MHHVWTPALRQGVFAIAIYREMVRLAPWRVVIGFGLSIRTHTHTQWRTSVTWLKDVSHGGATAGMYTMFRAALKWGDV